MASRLTAESVLQTISQRHLECQICTDRFKRPKMLECSHSFCLECLQQLAEKEGPSSRMLVCPACRVQTALTGKGVGGLRTDFKLTSLLDEIEQHETELQSQQEMKLTDQEYVLKCSEHINKDVIIYCNTCNTLICTTCIVQNHQSHSLIELNQDSDQHRQYAKDLLAKVSQTVQTFNNANQELDTYRKTLDTMFASTKEKIAMAADKEIAKEVAKVRQEKQKLLQEAEQIYKDRVKIMETAKVTNNKEITKAEQKRDEVRPNQCTEQRSCHNNTRHIGKLLQDLNEYTEMKPTKVPHGLTYMGFRKCQKSLGKLVLKNGWTLEAQIAKYLNTTQHMVELFPVDVASYSNGDIVVSDCRSLSLITVINPKFNVTPKARLIQGLSTETIGITVNKNDELIVLNTKGVNIYDRSYQLLHQFKIAIGSDQSDSKPSCVAVAVDNNNLMAVGYSNKGEISVHKPDGSLIRTLPAHGMGYYLTVHNRQLIYTNLLGKKLVSIDYNGDLVFSVDINQSGSPYGVCCDKDGSIYVAVGRTGSPSSSGEIHHHSPDGKYTGCIIKGCDNPPRGVTLTPSGDLAVADKTLLFYHLD